jgi:hypothetical protein
MKFYDLCFSVTKPILLSCVVLFAELQVFPEALDFAWWACVELSSLMSGRVFSPSSLSHTLVIWEIKF